jgi:CDP-diacylglycerol--serine O-phosphatidyltransferase
MKSVSVLPTLVTMGNGYCGILAIYKVHDGKFYVAAFLILLAQLFDVLDGAVARMAGTTSKFGAQIDSLCDAISFGVAPAFLAKATVEYAGPWFYHPKALTLLTGLFAIGAIVRLARYNVEHASGEGSDKEGKGVREFTGIPTPGAAGVVASLAFLAFDEKGRAWYPYVLRILPIVCVVLGYLMVSEVRYIHFGSRFLKVTRDFRYLFVVLLLAGLLTKWPEEMFALGFCAYAASGPVLAAFGAGRGKGGGGGGNGRGSGRDERFEIPEGV